MQGKLIGYYHSKGTFKPEDKDEGIQYDNVYLQFLSDLDNVKKEDSLIEGKRKLFTELKMKLKFFPDKFTVDISRLSELDDYIGKDFDWTYNKFGNVERIDLV